MQNFHIIYWSRIFTLWTGPEVSHYRLVQKFHITDHSRMVIFWTIQDFHNMDHCWTFSHAWLFQNSPIMDHSIIFIFLTIKVFFYILDSSFFFSFSLFNIIYNLDHKKILSRVWQYIYNPDHSRIFTWLDNSQILTFWTIQ